MTTQGAKNESDKFNPWEYAARAKKVDAILATIPRGDTDEANRRIAATLRSWSRKDRDIFARNAGQLSPSERTWHLIVEAVEERKAG